MGNWNLEGHKLAKCLKSETIDKGGMEQIIIPILSCKVSSELEDGTVQLGGYPTFINYNKHREKQDKKLKEQKRFRSLNKQIKRFAGRSKYEDLPSFDMPISTHAGDHDK